MSAGVIASGYELRKVFNDISPLFPTGTHVIPVLFRVHGSYLDIACTTGCVYRSSIPVNNPENVSWELTALYKSLVDFVKDGQIELKAETFGLLVKGSGFEIQLGLAYSTITWPDIPDVDFVEVNSTGYISGLRTLLNLGLDKIYAAEKPIHLYGSVAVIKYPNMQAQARTIGLDLVAVMVPEHVRMLIRFQPDHYYTNGVDSVILRRKDTFVILPMDVKREENLFIEFLNGMSEPITLSLDGLIDKLRNMSKLNPRGRCKLVLKESGLDITLSSENTYITTKLGDDQSKVLTALYLPMSVLLAMVKVTDGGKAQFLYKGDLLCLRTQSLIIVVRALV